MHRGENSRPACPEAVPRLAAGVRLATDRVTGRPILLYPEGVLLLNPTAAAVLGLCDGRRPLAEVVALLGDRYRTAREELTRDVTGLLDRLRERGLLHR